MKMKKSNKPKPLVNFWKSIPIQKQKTKSKIFSVSPVNLKSYPSRTKREIKLIDKNPWGDKDRDGVKNWFDCRPLNKHKQGKFEKEEIRKEYKLPKKTTRFQKHIIRVIEKDPTLREKMKGIKIITEDAISSGGYKPAGQYRVNFNKNNEESINLNPTQYNKGYSEEADVLVKQAIIHELKHREQAKKSGIFEKKLPPKETRDLFVNTMLKELGWEGSGVWMPRSELENEAVEAQKTPTPVDVIRKEKKIEKPEAIKTLQPKSHYYHATTSEYLPFIKKEGLLPLKELPGFLENSQYTKPEYVYFFDDPRDAKNWGHPKEMGTGTGKPVVLKVEVPEEEVVKDPHTWGWMVKGGIPPEKIEEMNIEEIEDKYPKEEPNYEYDYDENSDNEPGIESKPDEVDKFFGDYEEEDSLEA